jgi:hypothetical protein
MEGHVLITTFITLFIVCFMMQGLVELTSIQYRLSTLQAHTSYTHDLSESAIKQCIQTINKNLNLSSGDLNKYIEGKIVEWDRLEYEDVDTYNVEEFALQVPLKDTIDFYYTLLKKEEKKTILYQVKHETLGQLVETRVEIKIVVEESFAPQRIRFYQEKDLFSLLTQKNFAMITATTVTKNVETDKIFTTQKLKAPVYLRDLEKLKFMGVTLRELVAQNGVPHSNDFIIHQYNEGIYIEASSIYRIKPE